MVDTNAMREKCKRVASDILLIVVGVSIALAADSWLAERTEKARTNQLLEALEAEWTADLEVIDVYVIDYAQAMAGIIRIINAHNEGSSNLSTTDADSMIQQAYNWRTFNPSEGALNALLVDGVQNIEDADLRLAVASWQSFLRNLVAEQAALRELGAVDEPRISTRIAAQSRDAVPSEVTEYSHTNYGMEPGDFALAAIADDEYVATQRQTLGMLLRYRADLVWVRERLEQNLILLHERSEN